MLSIQSMLDHILRVNVVQNRICVWLTARRKYHYLKMFTQSLKHLLCLRPHCHVTIRNLTLTRTKRNLYLVVLNDPLVCVNQGLIHVENYCLFAFFKPKIPAVSGFIFYSAALLFAFWHTL